MATETELMAKLETAIGRISALEGELRSKPKAAEVPAAPAFDIYKFREALTIDPVGTMKAMQMNPEHVEHVRSILLADKMGDAASPHLKMMAMQGPQMMAAQATADSVANLSRRLDERDKQEQKAAKRESFKTISVDKEKYPNLAKAVSADPALFEEVDLHGGTAEEFAVSQEAKLKKLVAVLVPSAASVTADNKDQSTKVVPTPLAGALGGDPPAITKSKPGEWTREESRKLRDEIVLKSTSPKV